MLDQFDFIVLYKFLSLTMILSKQLKKIVSKNHFEKLLFGQAFLILGERLKSQKTLNI